MELEELKNTWATLDDRLKRQESLKENIIKKMMYEKSDKSVSRLINYGIFGLIACFGTLIILIYVITSILYENFDQYWKAIFIQSLLGIFILGFIAIIIVQVRILILLNKIDNSKPLKDNIQSIQRYKITYKKTTMTIYSIFIPLFIILLIGIAVIRDIGIQHWAFILFLIIAGIIYSIWEYKKFYIKNIKVIHDSLKELEELEELEEDKK